MPHRCAPSGTSRPTPLKYELGLYRKDGGESATRFFFALGFELESRRTDEFREPELWLFLRKG